MSVQPRLVVLFTAAAASAATTLAHAGGACGCAADLTGDGMVNGADLGQVIGAWGTADPVADLDGNGVVNGADLGLVIGAWGPCLAPANDSCANAQVVTAGSYAFCTTNATTDGPAFSLGSCGQFATNVEKDVWFQFNALSNGELTLSTCNDAYFDTVIAVYGSILPGLSPCPSEGLSLATFLTCNDDIQGCSGFSSHVTMNVTAGRSYKIRVGGYLSGDFGEGVLDVHFVSEGSSCENARNAVSGLQSQVLVGNTSDNPPSGLDPCNGVFDGPGEWIRYEPWCTGDITVSTCNPGTSFDTILTVLKWEFDSNCWSTVVDCNDDQWSTGCELNGLFRKSRVVFDAEPNAVYYIVVTGFNGASGPYELSIEAPECPGP